MGNCQAIDTATLVIEHPSGKVERLYWAVTASEIMKMNPGHCVALLISTTLRPSNNNENSSNKNNINNTNPVRVTRIKLLKPTDTLVLGHVYRLVTTQDVMKGLWAKKQAKMTNLSESSQKPLLEMDRATRRSEPHQNQVMRIKERNRTTTNGSSVTAKSRTWQPSLQSISEAAS